jgi:hypothetical protein
VFEQMGERRCVGEVVNRNEFEIWMMQRGAKKHAPGAAEAVDRDLGWHHESRFPLGFLKVVHSLCQRPSALSPYFPLRLFRSDRQEASCAPPFRSACSGPAIKRRRCP